MPPELQSTRLPAATAPSPVARGMRLCVRAYQIVVSPTLHVVGGPGCGCRFTPTCSHYALEALATHGALRGSLLTARRLLRCQPWGAHGADPVPPPATPASASASRSARRVASRSAAAPIPPPTPAQASGRASA